MAECPQAGCRFAETGVCLEGYGIDCPHLNRVKSVAETTPSDTLAKADTTSSEDEYRFHTGEKLTVSETSQLTNDHPVRVILCAGAQRSGKTTFLARLGEMFSDGSFENYKFAGSLTLCAFERLSWRATINSGVSEPDTRRTDHRENDTFLHLHVQPSDDTKVSLHLLVSDLAGETFPNAVASADVCGEQYALARANHLVIFLDSFCLCSPASRHSECDNIRMFLQRVIGVKYDCASLCVSVVFSRYDYITHHADHSEIEEYCLEFQEDLKRRFVRFFAQLTFRSIAARPSGGPATDTEIQLLLGHWLETPINKATTIVPRLLRPARDFSSYGLE